MRETGIHLDAESVRVEVMEGPYTARQREVIQNLGDAQINQAVRVAVDDRFWEMYDNVRSDAISILLARAGVIEKETE